MDYQQYPYQDDPANAMNYPLYGHSLSWEDMNKPKYGPTIHSVQKSGLLK